MASTAALAQALGWAPPEPFEAAAPGDGRTALFGLIWRPPAFDAVR
jgi:hypothetical protein